MARLLSLCSGIGVIDYVWSYILQQEIAGQVEINDYCQAVLAKRFPDVPKYRDLKELTDDDYARFGDVNLVAGGIPCQSFSSAGKQHGTADDRHLWPYAFAIVQRKQPAWVLVENVAGFIGLALDLVSSDLESEGYEVQAYVLPACAVGAPHERQRVFILAYSDRNRQRLRSHQSQRQDWRCETANISTHGTQEVMADASSAGRWQRDTATVTNAQSHATWRKIAPGSVEDTTICGCPQRPATERIYDQPDESGWCKLESRLGRGINGLANWLDRHQWPAGPGEQQHNWEPARTVIGRQPNRARRLEALGNAIVPQQIYPFLKFIADAERT